MDSKEANRNRSKVRYCDPTVQMETVDAGFGASKDCNLVLGGSGKCELGSLPANLMVGGDVEVTARKINGDIVAGGNANVLAEKANNIEAQDNAQVVCKGSCYSALATGASRIEVDEVSMEAIVKDSGRMVVGKADRISASGSSRFRCDQAKRRVQLRDQATGEVRIVGTTGFSEEWANAITEGGSSLGVYMVHGCGASFGESRFVASIVEGDAEERDTSTFKAHEVRGEFRKNGHSESEGLTP